MVFQKWMVARDMVSEMLNIFEGRDSTGLPVELERNRRESSMPRRFLA